MRSFRLSEISAVDRPAQAGAKMTIMKREFSQDERDQLAASGAALPDGSFPIKSKQDLENAIHAVGRASDPGKAKSHIISRAKTLGATDLLPDDWKAGKSLNEVDMTEQEINKKIEEAVVAKTSDLQKLLDEANATIAKAPKKKPVADGDAEDAADGGADEDTEKSKKRFEAAVAAEVEKRVAVVKADEAFEAEGVTIRKSEVGETAFKFMKAQAEKIELADFAKVAEQQFGKLPGEPIAKAKALRAIAKLGKEDREVVETMLKGGDAALKQGMSEIGHGASSSGAQDELNKRAAAYGTEHKLNKYVAMTKFLETAEGRELYKRVQDEKDAA
jgi:hypothetical protein